MLADCGGWPQHGRDYIATSHGELLPQNQPGYLPGGRCTPFRTSSGRNPFI